VWAGIVHGCTGTALGLIHDILGHTHIFSYNETSSPKFPNALYATPHRSFESNQNIAPELFTGPLTYSGLRSDLCGRIRGCHCARNVIAVSLVLASRHISCPNNALDGASFQLAQRLISCPALAANTAQSCHPRSVKRRMTTYPTSTNTPTRSTPVCSATPFGSRPWVKRTRPPRRRRR